MIEEKTRELLNEMNSLDLFFERSKNPTYLDRNREEVKYKPKMRIGTTFDTVDEIEVPFETHSLKTVSQILSDIFRLEKEIQDLNRQKLYLLQPDGDWDDSRASKAVFGIENYED